MRLPESSSNYSCMVLQEDFRKHLDAAKLLLLAESSDVYVYIESQVFLQQFPLHSHSESIIRAAIWEQIKPAIGVHKILNGHTKKFEVFINIFKCLRRFYALTYAISILNHLFQPSINLFELRQLYLAKYDGLSVPKCFIDMNLIEWESPQQDVRNPSHALLPHPNTEVLADAAGAAIELSEPSADSATGELWST